MAQISAQDLRGALKAYAAGNVKQPDPNADLDRQILEEELRSSQLSNTSLEADLLKSLNPQSGPDLSSLSAAQQTDVSDATTTLSEIDLAKDLLNRGADTGGSVQFKRLLRKIPGVTAETLGLSNEEIQLDAQLTSIKSNYLKFLSGAAVSEQEFERLSRFLPDAGDSAREIQKKLDQMEKTVKEKLNNLGMATGTGDLGTLLNQATGSQVFGPANPATGTIGGMNTGNSIGRFQVEVEQ